MDLQKGISIRRLAENYAYQIKEANLKVTIAQYKYIYKLKKVIKKETNVMYEKPPEPFNTATLQQEASRRLRFVPMTTMAIAQKLYEGTDTKGNF